MGPRPSISGELPIDTFFISSSKTTGTTRNKENRSLKRRTVLAADADDPNPSLTKKQRTKQPSEGADLGNRGKFRSEAVKARVKDVQNAFGTTSLPTPISVAKPPRSTFSRAPSDIEDITVTSPSSRSPRAPSFNAGDVACPTRNPPSGSGLPTPQTVRHESKKDPQTETIARLPIEPTVSHFVKKSGPVIPSLSLRPPLTPSRSKTKSDHIVRACRTTPHSQRIVPSSQWSDDYQPSVEPASSLEVNRDPFSVCHREEPNSCPDGLTLRPPPDIPSRYSSIASLAPIKLRTPTLAVSGTSKESFSKTALNTRNTKTGPLTLSSSSPISSRDYGQCSQIVPTSQFDEIDLKWSSQSFLFACPTLPPQTNHRDMAPSVERSQTGSLDMRDQRSQSEAIAEQEPSSNDSCHKPSDPPSPLTPLSRSSSQLPNAMGRKIDNLGAGSSPQQRALQLQKTPESPARRSSPESITDQESGGISQAPPEGEFPAEDYEDEDVLISPSPVRRQRPPASVKNTCSPADDGPSTSRHTLLRISHAKLRSIPNATVELDSDGEEMSSDTDFNLPATSQGVPMSCAESSYLDLVGSLPSAVEDFLEMIGTAAFSQ